MSDPCQPIQDRIATLRTELGFLQRELDNAPPDELVPRILEQMDEVRESIREQNEELERCRSQNPVPIRPHIGFEFRTCLNAELRQLIEQRLTEAFTSQNGIAHATCINGTERIGIWAPSVGEENTRRLGLESFNLLREPGETFGQSISLSYIQRNARAAWEARPKAFNGDGEPTPEGPVFLTNFSFRLESPNRVVTTTEGFRRLDIFPDIDFTATTTDTLRIVTGEEEAGHIHCDTSTHVDADFQVLGFLRNLFLGGPLGSVQALFQIGADIFDGSLGPENKQGGVGCSLLALFLERIELEEGRLLVFNYSRIEVFSGSILAGGTVSLALRGPRLLVTANLSARRASRGE